jgi:GTPase Era involved in 16S rRNA processing
MNIPEFAIIGHPNEGKSSVLSTLAEDDSVRVSSTPGETTECRSFPVVIDGREVLRFTDTPGFQNPHLVLSELRKRLEMNTEPLTSFRQFAATIPELHDDWELLGPVEDGAGIIYVVDGSRPLRNVDRAEMEILRLTGKPRMAIINCKDEQQQYIEQWKSEFRKNFNSYRTFNAHRATYAERISLLEALKSIDQDWQQVLSRVVDAFKKDWAARNETTADIMIELTRACMCLSLKENIGSYKDLNSRKEKLIDQYNRTLSTLEKESHQQIRKLFKHNIFSYNLPPHSLLNEDLFDEKTWQLLGLTRKQVLLAGGLGGAAIGVGLDAATIGHSLGLFAALGGAVGALGALLGGKNISGKAKLLGIPLGGEQLTIGPAKSIELLFVLLNRSLLYYKHTINWAHGRRDYLKTNHSGGQGEAEQNITRNWTASQLSICQAYYKTILKEESSTKATAVTEKYRNLLLSTLKEISEG